MGYDRLKHSVRLLFWSGQSFSTPGLHPEGSFKAAEIRLTDVAQIDEGLVAKWLAESGDLEGLLANPDIGGKRWSSVIAENESGLRRDLVLSTIRTDIPMSFALADFEPKPFDGIEEFFTRLGMKRHLSEVESLLPPATVDTLWGG